MIQYNQIVSSEGGDVSGNLVFVKEYENFIKKYPKSELMTDAEFAIGKLSFYYINNNKMLKKGNCTQEDIGMVNLAKKKTEEIIHKYPHAEVSKSAYGLLDEIKRFEKEYLPR